MAILQNFSILMVFKVHHRHLLLCIKSEAFLKTPNIIKLVLKTIFDLSVLEIQILLKFKLKTFIRYFKNGKRVRYVFLDNRFMHHMVVHVSKQRLTTFILIKICQLHINQSIRSLPILVFIHQNDDVSCTVCFSIHQKSSNILNVSDSVNILYIHLT